MSFNGLIGQVQKPVLRLPVSFSHTHFSFLFVLPDIKKCDAKSFSNLLVGVYYSTEGKRKATVRIRKATQIMIRGWHITFHIQNSPQVNAHATFFLLSLSIFLSPCLSFPFYYFRYFLIDWLITSTIIMNTVGLHYFSASPYSVKFIYS